MQNEIVQKKIDESFVCHRCNECCRQPGFVYVSSAEADRIADYLGLEPFEFVNQYCDLQDRQKLVLKKKQNEVCIFLNEYGCQIHSVKPKQCSEFPFKWRTERSFEYCQGLKEIFK